jgi:hypothetical protein
MLLSKLIFNGTAISLRMAIGSNAMTEWQSMQALTLSKVGVKILQKVSIVKI